MKEVFPLPDIPGYIDIKGAAQALGVAESSIYRYIQTGRLPAYQAGHNIMVELEALKQFKPGQAGRPRTKPPLWRESPSDGTFVMSVITVQVRTGQQVVLMEWLRTMRQQKQHLFPGTVARYITEDDHSPDTIEIQLIWKQSEMPGEEAYQEALEAFRAAFKDVLDWQTAHYVTKTVLLHT